MPGELDIVISDGTITISARAPFIEVSGTLSPAGAISATGRGTIEAFGDVDASFEGTLADEQLTGTYTLTGPVPGGSIAFEVEGEFDG